MNFQKRNKKRKQRIIKTRTKNIVTLSVIAFCSFIFTTYIMLNAYEQISLQDLEFVSALRPVMNNNTLQKIVDKDHQKTIAKHPMNRDQLRYIQISHIRAQIELAHSIKNGDQWYIRGNKAHIISHESNNNIIIYLDQNWRTTYSLKDLRSDDLIFLLSNDYNYIFQVKSKVRNVSDYKLEPNEEAIPQLTILAEDKDGYRIFTAQLINSSRR